jgi:hypothetical protein
MRQLTGMLTALVCVFSVVAMKVTLANAQNDVTALENLPVLETVDSSSATDLTGLQDRQAKLDYGFLFLSVGAGGERPVAATDRTPSYSSSTLMPAATALKPAPQNLPPYAVVKPNRAIETQTDPQRLTVVAPTSQQQK